MHHRSRLPYLPVQVKATDAAIRAQGQGSGPEAGQDEEAAVKHRELIPHPPEDSPLSPLLFTGEYGHVGGYLPDCGRDLVQSLRTLLGRNLEDHVLPMELVGVGQ